MMDELCKTCAKDAAEGGGRRVAVNRTVGRTNRLDTDVTRYNCQDQLGTS